MSSRMFVILSSRVGPEHLEEISPDDIVVVGPGIELDLPSGIRVRRVPPVSGEELRQVTRKLADGLHMVPSGDGRDLVECLLNDCYAYAIRPTYSILEFLKKVLDEEEIGRIRLLAAGRSGGGLPLVGFRTTESPRGSRDLLNAFIAQVIAKSFPGIPIDMVRIRGDFYCIEPFRKTFMVCANLFFIAIFSLKCMAYLRGRRGRLQEANTHGFIVRVPHQARFATRILSTRRDATIFAFPQASQGSLRSFGRMVREDLRGCAVEPIRPRALLAALRETIRDIRVLGKFARTPNCVDVGGDRITMRIDFSDMARELMIFPVLVFYKNLLAASIAASNCRTLVTFELVGRMAGIESLVARRAGIPSTTVQTALVSAIPHVVFPWSSLFFTDGPEVADKIGGIGAVSYGHVRYAGSTFSLESVKEAGEAREIGFFTQPYEPMVTLEILRLLCENAMACGGHVYLKIHPRDEERTYKDLVSRYCDVLRPVSCRPDVLLERVDLCVTRTSSVAKEAIAAGVPIVLCLWTKMDKSIRADYVRPEDGLNYCSSGADDLRSIIANYAELRRVATELGGLLFGGLGIHSLRSALFDDAGGACTPD